MAPRSVIVVRGNGRSVRYIGPSTYLMDQSSELHGFHLLAHSDTRTHIRADFERDLRYLKLRLGWPSAVTRNDRPRLAHRRVALV